MEAKCLNSECEKNAWTLRKHPSQYAGRISCPDCGSPNIELSGGEAQNTPQTVDQSQSQSDNLPAQSAGMGQFAQEAGAQLADMRDASPEEKAQVEGMALTALGKAIQGFGKRTVEKKMEGIQRAKNRDGSLEKVETYPECPDCGTQITNLPEAGTEFTCPSCRARLRA